MTITLQERRTTLGKTNGQRGGQDRHVATVLPKLRWVFAAQCVPRAGRLQTETTGPISKQSPRMPSTETGERAAEVLCLYAALVDKALKRINSRLGLYRGRLQIGEHPVPLLGTGYYDPK
jgi:hypothetical protein